VKGPLAILSYIGIGIAVLLVLVGVASLFVVVSAQVGLAPAREILKTASGTTVAGPVVTPTPEVEPAKTEPPTGIMYSSTERVVNLSDKGTLRYLKTQVVLELVPVKGKLAKMDAEAYKKAQDEAKKELSPKAAMIEDQIATILSSRTSAELITADGKQKAKDDLRERLGEVVAAEYTLPNVYFTQFIIQ
jgi:flagellar basal body-associated protein FliL